MDKLHVRNIFSLILPLRAEEIPHVNIHSSSSNFGFTLTYPSHSSSVSYRLNLYSDFRAGGQGQKKTEVSFTSPLQWAKKNAISFQKYDNTTIEALIFVYVDHLTIFFFTVAIPMFWQEDNHNQTSRLWKHPRAVTLDVRNQQQLGRESVVIRSSPKQFR